MKTRKYKVVVANDLKTLESGVNALLELGWELHGNVQISLTSSRRQDSSHLEVIERFAQTLVLNEKGGK